MKTEHHETAGGVVVNDAGEILVLERDVQREDGVKHEFRLPKGHIDPGETEAEAAVREVGEESGYWEVEIVADLGPACSRYDFQGVHHVRNEHYFLMRLTNPERGEPQFVPNSEEELFTPVWLAPAEAQERMTYPTERDFVGRARERLDGEMGEKT